MNKVILIGRFAQDPEMRQSGTGEVARYSLACQGDFTNRNGERDTQFIRCVSFGNTASLIGRYCKKGNMISAVGRISNSSYDAKDGSKRYSTDIIVENIEFVGSRNGGDSMPAGGDNSEMFQPAGFDGPEMETSDITEDPYKDFGDEITLSNDDLPF